MIFFINRRCEKVPSTLPDTQNINNWIKLLLREVVSKAISVANMSRAEEWSMLVMVAVIAFSSGHEYPQNGKQIMGLKHTANC